MEKFIISGGKPLRGEVQVGGAKNVALKVMLAGLLTDDEVVIHNVPMISSVLGTTEVVKLLGASVTHHSNTITISGRGLKHHKVPLEFGSLYRTAPMLMAPLLARFGKAIVPNPGGCRIGKRPIDWLVTALEEMGIKIKYKAGYFYAEGKLIGATIKFTKNTHTGTETVILAAVLADGETVIENAAEEPEIDDLILLLNHMGAQITRQGRTIQIKGVTKLHGAQFSIMPDRNEVVTYAVAAIATRGAIVVKGTQRHNLRAFLKALDDAQAGWEPLDDTTTKFFYKGDLKATAIETQPHPGFMTDWQAPWAVLMTEAHGVSTIHETVFESRFSYVQELKKMGAKIDYFQPQVSNPAHVYNFNLSDREDGNFQAIKIHAPAELHEAVVEIDDLRAGATLVVAALVAHGKSILSGVEQIDRGYAHFDAQLRALGAQIKRIKSEV